MMASPTNEFSEVVFQPERDSGSTGQPQQQASDDSAAMYVNPLSEMKARMLRDPGVVAKLYSAKERATDEALEHVLAGVYNKDLDGEVIGHWLLLEVDHWDNETEKMVVLTSQALLVVRYDFVSMKVYKHRRISLKEIDTVCWGDFAYPKMSLNAIPDTSISRQCGGVRLKWNKGVEPKFTARWSPLSDSMPWITFTYHHLHYVQRDNPEVFSVQDFLYKIVYTINEVYRTEIPDRKLTTTNEPLLVNVYLPLTSAVNNQSMLGVSRERGGISF